MDEYTVQFQVPLLGEILFAEGGGLVVFPVDHTLGWEIAEVIITLLDEEFYVNPFALSAGPPSLHAITHQAGGSDQINVEALLGELAQAQKPKATVIPIIALAAPMAF